MFVFPHLAAAAVTIGWLAGGAVVVAYGLLMSGRVTSDSIAYLIVNAFGSAGLALSTAVEHAWQSVAVNLLWLIFGLAPLARALRQRLGHRCERPLHPAAG